MNNRYFLLILIFFNSLLLFSQENNLLYSFQTKKNKEVQLLYNERDRIFSYRFLSRGKLELQVDDDLNDQDTIFVVKGYHRGGGVQNAAMDLNSVIFSNNGYQYEVYYVWSVNEENPEIDSPASYGVRVSKDGKEIYDYVGIRIIKGEIYGWSFINILPEAIGQE